MAFLAAFVLVFSTAAGPTTASATNGMNLIGYGPGSTALGGADVAVPAACTPIAGNPANLSQVCTRSFSAGLTFLAPRIRLTTKGAGIAPNADISAENQNFPFPFLAYASRVRGGPWALGFGVFGQGGMGVDFDSVATAFGTTDRLFSRVRLLRATPTAVYNLSDRLAVGVALHAGYADANYKFFPYTSFFTGDKATSFFGQKLENADTATLALRIGVRYDLTPRLSLGADYSSESALNFEGGTLYINYDAIGLGIVRYRATVEGFTWPEQLRFGLSYRFGKQMLVAAEIRYVRWAHAVDKIVIKGKTHNDQVAPEFSHLRLAFPLNWKDQWVLAVGAQYSLGELWKASVGYNYGTNPVPNDHLSPLFPATVEHHMTMGIKYGSGRPGSWSLQMAYEHTFEDSSVNNNTSAGENPFGAGMKITHYQDVVSILASRTF